METKAETGDAVQGSDTTMLTELQLPVTKSQKC